MKREMEELEAEQMFKGLVREIHSLPEEEKLLFLERIVRAELEDKINPFWAKVAKKMLVSEETTSIILSGEDLIFDAIKSDTLSPL